jgi:branched-chain amino acid transport system permease protein
VGDVQIDYLFPPAVPSLRIKGLYLAVATLAMQFLLVYVFREWEPVTGGVRGVNVPPAAWFGWPLDNDVRVYALIVPVAVLLLVAARNLFRTRNIEWFAHCLGTRKVEL